MKRWFSLLGSFILSLVFAQVVQAQAFEFEVVRTPEVPGFFMVEILPGANAIPMNVQDIFIQNYSDDEAEKYKELLPLIQELGGRVEERSVFDEYKGDPTKRFILLGGEEEEGYLHFVTTSDGSLLEQFDAFSSDWLGPVFLQNVTVEFGGNISEVVPPEIRFVGANSAVFVGKFEQPMKTRMEIRGVMQGGELVAMAPVDLADGTLADHPLAASLPQIWDELYHQKEKEESAWWDTQFLINIFPWVTGGIGLIIILWAVGVFARFSKKDDLWDEELSAEEMDYHLRALGVEPTSETKSAPEQESSLPKEKSMEGTVDEADFILKMMEKRRQEDERIQTREQQEAQTPEAKAPKEVPFEVEKKL